MTCILRPSWEQSIHQDKGRRVWSTLVYVVGQQPNACRVPVAASSCQIATEPLSRKLKSAMLISQTQTSIAGSQPTCVVSPHFLHAKSPGGMSAGGIRPPGDQTRGELGRLVGQSLPRCFEDSANSVRFSRGCGERAAKRGVASRVGGKRSMNKVHTRVGLHTPHKKAHPPQNPTPYDIRSM